MKGLTTVAVAFAMLVLCISPSLATTPLPPTKTGPINCVYESTRTCGARNEGRYFCPVSGSNCGGCYCDLTDGNFDPTASIGPHGYQVQIGGHFICNEGAIADLRVTLTQQGTGAIAEGRTRIACTGELSDWQAPAQTIGPRGFIPGPATACGLAVLPGGHDQIPDAIQWCREEIEITP